MDPRVKDAVRHTEELVIGLVEEVKKLQKITESLKKDFKSIKRASVRKYKKEDGKS